MFHCPLCGEMVIAGFSHVPETKRGGYTSIMGNEIPRRIRMDLMTPAELAITKAVHATEAMPADPLLTEAVILLLQARDKVADYVDREEK